MAKPKTNPISRTRKIPPKFCKFKLLTPPPPDVSSSSLALQAPPPLSFSHQRFFNLAITPSSLSLMIALLMYGRKGDPVFCNKDNCYFFLRNYYFSILLLNTYVVKIWYFLPCIKNMTITSFDTGKKPVSDGGREPIISCHTLLLYGMP